MFESVLERNLPARQFGRGATLAIGVHAVALLGALYLSARPTPVIQKEIPTITVFAPGARVVPAVGNAGGGSTPTAKSPNEHRAARSVRSDVDKSAKRAEEPSSSASGAGDLGHGATHSGPTDAAGVAPGGGAPSGTGVGGLTIALPFGEGMQRPTPIAQPAPLYTREASAARSEGTVSVRCIITVEGTLKNCRIAKGIPYMDQAVLDALAHWRYTPVTFQGRPVSVYYSINLRLVAP